MWNNWKYNENKCLDNKNRYEFEKIDLKTKFSKNNDWQYNKWILPNRDNNHCKYEIVDKNLALWDKNGINKIDKIKIPITIPLEIPNMGNIAVNMNDSSWLFNPIRGNINNN